MTLILACLTHDAVYQVSDRRLTSANPPYPVIDDESNKAVVVDGRMSFGYTGLAKIAGKRTDEWLYYTIDDGPTNSALEVANRIAERASSDFSKIRLPAKLKRQVFQCVGWFKCAGERGLSPGIIYIYNALDPVTGDWLDQALPEFKVTVDIPTEYRAGSYLSSVGIDPTDEQKLSISRLMRKCIRHKNATFRAAEKGLIISVHWLSTLYSQIGSSLMVSYLPKKSAENYEKTGKSTIFAGPAGKDVPSFFYVSGTGSRMFYGPHVIIGGEGVMNFQVSPL